MCSWDLSERVEGEARTPAAPGLHPQTSAVSGVVTGAHQAFRLAVLRTAYGCGSAPDFDRLPLDGTAVQLSALTLALGTMVGEEGRRVRRITAIGVDPAITGEPPEEQSDCSH
jgi:hypothetical protein